MWSVLSLAINDNSVRKRFSKVTIMCNMDNTDIGLTTQLFLERYALMNYILYHKILPNNARCF